MPNQWDLTNENIENTYQRVLQTPDGVNIYDGTGSLFTVTAVAAPAGPNQSVQFNDAGTTSGSSNFTFDKINNIANLTGSLIATSFTGSLQGTASWVYSASQALTASYTPNALTTASVSSNVITFTKGDGSTFPITVNTGSGTTVLPGGVEQSIQFKSGSNFSGSSNLKFDYTANNVILTGSILMSGSSAITGVDYIDFDTTASIATSTGRLHWNDVDGTLELGLKGGVVSSELGQGLVTRIVNKTVPNIDLLAANYQVVVVAGAQGQRLAVKLAQADNDANSAGTLGIVAENIDKNQEGFVITVGLLKDRDTTGTLQGETWNDGDILYLSPTTAGAITNIKPQAPQHTVIIGYVEYAHQNNGKIYVKIDNGYELDELHNVRITTASLTAGQLLVRSGSNNGGVWINSNQLTGSYELTGSLNATLGFTGSLFGTASWAYSASQALTASFAPNYVLISDTSSMLQPYVLTSVTSSMLQPYVLTSQTSSMTVATASFVTGSNVVGDITGNANNITAFTINQNLGTTNQVTFSGVTASLQGTASWAYSASQALTASFLPVNTYSITSSWAQSASQALTASYVTGSIYNSNNPALSSSYALTASYAVSSETNLGLVYAVSLGYLMP